MWDSNPKGYVFDMFDFDVILGIDFLSQYGIEIDYQKKKVKFHLNDVEEFIFDEGCMLSLMIKNIKTRKLLNKIVRVIWYML